MGVKDVGRYRWSSNISWLWHLWHFWLIRCVELDYSQDKINIDYDYGQEWKAEETDETETKTGKDGELTFVIFRLLDNHIENQSNLSSKSCSCSCSVYVLNMFNNCTGVYVFVVGGPLTPMQQGQVWSPYSSWWPCCKYPPLILYYEWLGEAFGEQQKGALPPFPSSSQGHLQCFNLDDVWG